MTLATSMAARQGPVAMAAHQICLQVWLAVSLITDALAASGQVYLCLFEQFVLILIFLRKTIRCNSKFYVLVLALFLGLPY